MPLQQVERTSVAGSVFRQLLQGILDGEWAPGASLPSERDLTEVLGVNRQAVREALQRLDQMGLVEIRHGGPTRVADYRRRGGLDLLTHLLVSADGAVDAGVARSVMEMRAVIGPDLARLCALRAAPALVAELRTVINGMRAADDPLDRERLHLRFWDALADGSDNVAYQLCLNGLRHLYRPIEGLVHLLLADEMADVEAHRRVVDAVAAADPAAAEAATRALLATGAEAIEQALRALDDVRKVTRP